MVSLWGSKNGESNHDEDHDEEQNGEGSRPTSRPARTEPDERTQLLPPSRAGFLDPDDPAVSLDAHVAGLMLILDALGVSV